MKDSKNLDERVVGEISCVNLKFTLQISLPHDLYFQINMAIN